MSSPFRGSGLIVCTFLPCKKSNVRDGRPNFSSISFYGLPTVGRRRPLATSRQVRGGITVCLLGVRQATPAEVKKMESYCLPLMPGRL